MRVTKRVRNDRHRPASGFPYSRLMAATMLASLISALFTLPAQAAAGQIDFSVVSSVPAVLPNGTFAYTVTLTNNSGVDADTLAFTDTVSGGGTMGTVTPSTGGLCSPPSSNATDCSFATLAIGASATVTISVTAPSSIGTVTNTVSAFLDTQGDAANPASPSASTTVENADVQVTKTHSPATVSPGGALTYTVAVKNNGPSIASGVTLTDNAPAGVTFGTVSVTSSDPTTYTCGTATATQVVCALGTIAVNTTVTVTINATLASSATGQITNTASETATTLDATMGNNTAVDVLTPAQVDLALTLAVSPTSIAPGGTVTYTVNLQNLSADTDATNVTVTDTLPAGLAAVTPPPTPATGAVAVANNLWTWTIPTVPKSSTVTASFDATVDQATTLTKITNTAGITKADQTDPVTTNNTASVDLTIAAGVADLEVTTAVDDSKPNKGDVIKIAIQVANAGPDDATNVVLKDVLPNGLKYKSCTGCKASGGKGRAQWSGLFTAASIPADSSATIILNGTVQTSDGTLKNTASIQSLDQTDPDGSNDTSSLKITVGAANNSGGGAGGGTSGTSGGGTSGAGDTAFTGFTAGGLIPWFLLLAALGLAALEYARRRPLVAVIGHTYGFDPWI